MNVRLLWFWPIARTVSREGEWFGGGFIEVRMDALWTDAAIEVQILLLKSYVMCQKS